MSPKSESEPDLPEGPPVDPDVLLAMFKELREMGGGASHKDIIAEVRSGREPRYPSSDE